MPSGGTFLLDRARESVREVCKATNFWQQKVEYPIERDREEYELPHSGFDFCQMLAIHILFTDQQESHNNRLSDGSQDDVDMGIDVSIWRFLRLKSYDLAHDAKLVLKFSLMPRMDSEQFPQLLYNQHCELLRLCCLKNMGSFQQDEMRKRTGINWAMMYREQLIAEKARMREYNGPIDVYPYYGTIESEGYGGGGSGGYL